jgi:sugar phosphate isomerase/epimerase
VLQSPKKQKEEVARLKKEVDVAAALGAPSTRQDVTRGFPPDWQGATTFAAALKVIVPALREITEYAQEKGVITSLENHGFYMQDSTRVKKLLDAVNHPNYRLTMDMGNFLCVNENPVQAVQRLVDYAVIVHAKDFHVRPKKLTPPSGWFQTPTPIALRGAIVGHGEIDIPAQLRILKKAKYQGYLSLEFEGMEEPVKAVTLGLEYLTRELTAIKALG